MEKLLYQFGMESTEGNSQMKDLLGGKGANLAEMCNLGIPVPPGFTITTEICKIYYDNGKKIPQNLIMQANESLAAIDGQMRRFQ